MLHKCDVRGSSLRVDDIEVTIPPGAIPPGETVHVEMGVALYGPFSFAENYHQVSPVLWFCTQENVDFLLPVKFKLPHVFMDRIGVKLSFAKAYHSPSQKGAFSFTEENSDTPSMFVFGEKPYGILTSKHCCFLCIKDEVDSNSVKLKDLCTQRGYCLHILVKKKDAFTYKIVVTCTYFLQTCIRVSVIQIDSIAELMVYNFTCRH